MLTLSDLAAESQAVLKLGISRVMVINKEDEREREKRERKRERKHSCTKNISNKHVDLDKKGMRYLCKNTE